MPLKYAQCSVPCVIIQAGHYDSLLRIAFHSDNSMSLPSSWKELENAKGQDTADKYQYVVFNSRCILFIYFSHQLHTAAIVAKS